MARAAAHPHTSRSPLSPAVVGVLLRRLRLERELGVIIFAVVLVTSFVFAAAPRQFNRMADDGLAYEVRNASPYLRNIQTARAWQIPPAASGDIFANVDLEGDDFLAKLPRSVQRIIADRTYVVDTVRYHVYEPPDAPPFPFPRYITLRYQNRLDQHIQLIDGRMPVATNAAVELPAGQNQPPQTAHVYEIAVSTETAGQLGVQLGDRLVMDPYSDDGLVRVVPMSQRGFIAVEIVGLFEVTNPDDEYWMGNPEIHRATEYDDGNMLHIFATAVMAAEAYPQLYERTPFPFRYSWRYFVDPAAFDAGDLDQLAADVRRLDAEYSSYGSSRTGDLALRTGLSDIFRRYFAQRDLTVTILSVATIGLLAVAFAVIGLVAALVAGRRRDAIALVRGRGGSARQIVGAQLVEGLLLSLPASLLALLLVSLLVPGRSSTLSLVVVGAITIVTTLLLVGSTLPVARQSLGLLDRGDAPLARVSPRRLVFELAVVALAVVGVYLLRRRGLAGDSSTDELTRFDPYLAAVPMLLGLAVGLVVLRLYPIPVRAFAWAAALRRDLVPVLGFRRAGRQPGATNLPLLVLLLSVAVGVFASVLLVTIDDGQVTSSWQGVGADYRVDPGGSNYLSSRIDLDDVAGVEVVAGAYLVPDVPLASRSGVQGLVVLDAIQTDEYAAVTAGTPSETRFPAALLAEPEGNDIGQPSNPIPAIVSRVIGNRTLEPGDTFALRPRGGETTLVVAEVRDRFPGLPVDRPFVVTSFDLLQAVNPDRPLRPTTLFIRAPDAAGAAIQETLDRQSRAADLTSRHAEYAAVHNAPLIAGVTNGFRIGLLVAAAYSALAVVVALTLAAGARARDLAYLRTLGLSVRQAVGLTVVEQVPPVVFALAAGVGLGIAVARLIEPGLDLTVFTGGGIPVELRIDWSTIALLSFGLAVVVAGAIAAVSHFARRISLGETLRLGDN